MGYALLEQVLDILRSGGIRAGEEYPAGERVEILNPVAAVGLRELDCGGGVARFSVRILSPRILGGWCCQVKGAEAVRVLHEAGLSCQTEQMEYLRGSDCFCVSITAQLPVEPGEEGWVTGSGWQVLCGGVRQEQVLSFRAVRNQGRRIVGGMAQAEPVTVTLGSGGWELELVQTAVLEPEEETEPFELMVLHRGTGERYTGCCWNETEILHSAAGGRLTRRGFALTREVISDG